MDLKQRVAQMLMSAATALKAEEQKLATAVLDSGQTIETDAEAWEVGVAVFVVNDEGEQIPLPDGAYTLEDGQKFVAANGVVAEWMPAEEETEAKEEAVDAEAEVLTRETVAQMIADAIQGVQASFEQRFEAKEAEIQNLAKQPAARGVERLSKPTAKVPLAELAAMTEAERVRVLMSNF